MKARNAAELSKGSGNIMGKTLGSAARTIGLRCAVSSAALATILGGAPAAHAQTAAVIAFEIDPQSLGGALAAFTQKTGITLAYGNALPAINSPGVRGRMSAAEALSRILAGTGLIYRFTGPTTVTLEPVPAADTGAVQLGPVRVEAVDGGDETPSRSGGNLRGPSPDPVAQRLNPLTTVGSKSPVRQRELPQSISVITQDRIENQDLFNLEDAVRETPGLVVRTGDSERFMFYARGFPVDQIQYDGIPTTIANSATSLSLLMYERIEVLCGPAGLYNGIGGEGGSINLVRKRAPAQLQASIDASVGSRSNYRGEAAIGDALNDAQSIRAYGAVSYQSQDLPADTTYRRDVQVFGTVEADLGRDTTLRIGAATQELRQRAAWMGYPVYSDYRLIDIPRSRFLGQPWNRNVYRTTTEYAELAHQTQSGWTFKVTSNFFQHRNDILTSAINGPADPITGDFPMGPSSGKWNEDQYGVDTYVSGPVRLFGRTHNLTLGTNYQSYVENQSGYNGDAVVNNIFHPLDGPAPSTTPNVSIDRESTQYGIYGNFRFSVADPLTVVVGGRITWVDSKFNYYFSFETDLYHDKYNAKATPFAGVVWDISHSLTAYASYAQVFTPQFTRDAAGNVFKPITGSQMEIGLKGEYLDGRLDTSAALFRILDNNRTKDDPRFPGQFISIAQGRARSQGFELQVSGELAKGLILLAGYTYTQTKYYDDSRNANGDFETFAPKHLLKAQIDYTLPGALNRWSIGGGVQAQSKTFVYDIYGGGTVTQGSYATTDLRATFKPIDKIAISISGTNIFDKRYWSTLGGLYGGNFLGNPRAVIASVRWHH